ncbi:MAG: TetR/AcrR family transcriptional regulator, partial [Candidatus Binataceae bacterium]
MAGARTETIARRARVNKRMLFYCFGSKQGLYAEVLRRKIADKAEVIASTPEDLGAALKYWTQIGCGDVDWVRMHEWEALGPAAGPSASHSCIRIQSRSSLPISVQYCSAAPKSSGVEAIASALSA